MLAIARGLMAQAAHPAARRALARARAGDDQRAVRRPRRACATRASPSCWSTRWRRWRSRSPIAAMCWNWGRSCARTTRGTGRRSRARGGLSRPRRGGAIAVPRHVARSHPAQGRLTGKRPGAGRHRRRRAAASSRSRRASTPTRRRNSSTAGWRSPGFVETHIHLDKSCILDRCNRERGTLEEAIANGGRGQARLHRGRRLCARATHPGESHPPGHDAHAHPCRGRSARRAERLSRRTRRSSANTPGRSTSRSAYSRRRA